MEPGHFIAIFGGAVAGSEAASELSKRGVHTVVFDQNILPYGKLETGLPKWHEKLRDRQEGLINGKLNHPLISLVPGIKLGKDLEFAGFLKAWGFSAVLLATGAWRDRPLPLPGIDEYVGNGLLYQNPFVNWFNQNHDPDYNGPQYDVPDDAIIVGGGLASLDVAKIVMIESTRTALKKKGIEVDALTIEKKGVVKVLAEHNLNLEKLGLKGCTLYTRHGIGEMPLTTIPDDATRAEIEKAALSRERILSKVLEKFPFRVAGNQQATDTIIRNGRLAGLVFSETRFEGNKYVLIPGTGKAVEGQLVISAIGSIPEPIAGIPMRGEIYEVENTETGKLKNYDNVFALGNAVTGRGNIRQSQMHGRQVTESIVDQYLAWEEKDYQEIFEKAESRVDRRVDSIFTAISERRKLSSEHIEKLYRQINELQDKVGYHRDYHKWVREHLPLRLENMLGH